MRQRKLLLVIGPSDARRAVPRANLAGHGVALAIAGTLDEAIGVAETIAPWRLVLDAALLTSTPDLVLGLLACPSTRDVPVEVVADCTSWPELRRVLLAPGVA